MKTELEKRFPTKMGGRLSTLSRFMGLSVRDLADILASAQSHDYYMRELGFCPACYMIEKERPVE